MQACSPGGADDVGPQRLGAADEVLAAAVEDGLLAGNPCASSSVRAPKTDGRHIVPWTVERVQGVTDGHPTVLRAAPVLGAGCGLRQGEVFGLELDAVDFLRRDVPLPDVVSVALAERLRRSPAVDVILPWLEPDGPPRTAATASTRCATTTPASCWTPG